MISIDAHSITRSFIDNTFSYLTWHKDVCDELKFKGISQVWVQDPAWYFWLEGIDGAFLLRFLDAEVFDDAINVNLAIHFFPSTASSAFCGLNQREKDLLGSTEMFDTPTLTPQFEHYDLFIPYFVIAELGAVITADNNLSLLYLSTDQGDNHPLSAMADMLIGAVNYYRKKPQTCCYKVNQSDLKHLFLEYEDSAMSRFLDAFDLDLKAVLPVQDNIRTDRWSKASDFHTKCTVTSSCGCHQH